MMKEEADRFATRTLGLAKQRAADASKAADKAADRAAKELEKKESCRRRQPQQPRRRQL